jgi:hypothetical protein
MGNYADLPTGILDLETPFAAQDYLDVDADDGTRVAQSATGEYSIFQFKDYVGDSNSCSLTWNGQSSLAPLDSTVYLAIFNRDTPGWEVVDSDDASNADTDFNLTANIADLTNYKDVNGVIVCRIYQLGT